MYDYAIRPTPTVPTTRDGIRTISLGEPLHWIGLGVRDFRAAPGPSLLYGALFAATCWAVMVLSESNPWFVIAYLTGLLLLGSLFATGLYVAARQLDSGGPVSIPAALRTLASRRSNLALFAVFLMLIMVAWVRLSALLFAINFDLFSPTIPGYLEILGGQGDPSVLVYFVGIGFLLAATVFVTSAVAIPMIVDRDVNPFTAIATSARAVKRNWPAMLFWASIIVVLTAFGISTFFIGFVVLFPVLGYATWRSYRALVE
jgi:uncharacterized membrane protein